MHSRLRPVSVCLVVPSFGLGGAEYATVRLARALADASVKVTVVVTREPGLLAPQVPKAVPLSCLNVRKNILSVPKLASEFRKLRPDVIIPVMAGTAVTACLAVLWTRRWLRHAVVLPVLHTSIKRSDGSLPIRLVYRFLEALLFLLCGKIVCVSEGIQREIGVAWPWLKQRLETIPNIIWDDEFGARVARAITLRRPPEERTIVCCGRLIWAKGFDVFLRAFATMCETYDSYAKIVGDGPERGALESLASELGISHRVSFTGELSDPLPVMASATVLVHSSRYDALPTVVVEAMALGLAVIVTDSTGGAGETIGFGACGEMVPPGDEVALASAMRRVFDDPARRTQLADLGARRAQQYTAAAVTKRFNDLIHEVVAR